MASHLFTFALGGNVYTVDWDKIIRYGGAAVSLLAASGFLYSKLHTPPGKRQVKDQCVLITGCDSGFGKMTALRLVKQGYVVFAGCLDKVKAAKDNDFKVQSGKLKLLQMDVTDRQQIEDAVKLVDSFLDANKQMVFKAIVNNAGIFYLGETELMPSDMTMHMMKVNYMGVVNTTNAFLPVLRRSDAEKSKPRVVVLASAAGLMSLPSFSGYCASKAAVLQWSNGLRFDIARFGIQVSSICPDFHATEMVVNVDVNKAKCDSMLEKMNSRALTAYGGRDAIRKQMMTMVELFPKFANRNCQPVVDALCDAVANDKPRMVYVIVNPLHTVLLGIGTFFPAFAAWVVQKMYLMQNLSQQLQ